MLFSEISLRETSFLYILCWWSWLEMKKREIDIDSFFFFTIPFPESESDSVDFVCFGNWFKFLLSLLWEMISDLWSVINVLESHFVKPQKKRCARNVSQGFVRMILQIICSKVKTIFMLETWQANWAKLMEDVWRWA